jgi:hypothetical protein
MFGAQLFEKRSRPARRLSNPTCLSAAGGGARLWSARRLALLIPLPMRPHAEVRPPAQYSDRSEYRRKAEES